MNEPRNVDLVPRTLLRGVLLLLFILVCPVATAGAAELPEDDREAMVEIAETQYGEEFLLRARAYHEPRYFLFFVQLAVTVVVLLWLGSGPLGAIGRWGMRAAGGHAWLARTILLTLVLIGFGLVRLPFSIVRFLHAEDYGLRTDTLSSFLGDWASAFGLGWVMTLVVGLSLLGLFSVMRRGWWLVAGVVISVLTVGYVTLAPLVIDPIFNDFERLADKELEGRLLELADRGGVPAQEVWVSDASRRTRAVNAYFTGFGDTRRIVLYDTLLEQLTPDEVALVVAHEVGHWKHHHIRWGLVLGLAATFLGLWITERVLRKLVAYGVADVHGRGDPGLVIPAYATYAFLMWIALVPSNWVSRNMETQADREALALVASPDLFVQTEIRIANENLSDVLPPPWVESTLFTHPANTRRILMAERAR